ncbi:MAG: leucine-rich repeat domain-containing protein [Spirochaetaceae bacterium]|jgi:hypothetical protein|nr:leucine-rich repeat domain-containing protein [Spirochaetaceae bacterium]
MMLAFKTYAVLCALVITVCIGCANTAEEERLKDTLDTTEFSSLEDLKDALDHAAQNTAENPYAITLKGVDLSALGSETDGLGRLFAVLQGRYISLNLRGCAGSVGSATEEGIKARPDTDKLVSLTLDSATTAIGALAFAGCTNLVSVTLPTALNTIGDGAFSGCAALRFTVAEGNHVFTTGQEGRLLLRDGGTTLVAFHAARDTVQLSPSITTIRDYAFAGSGLRELVLNHETPPALGGTRVFESLWDLKICVQREKVPEYTTKAPWNAYAAYIRCIADWHKPPFTDFASLGAWLDTTQGQNSRVAPYYAVLKGVALSNKGTGELLEDGLRKLYEAFHGKYIALDLDGCTGATIGFSDLYDQSFSGRPDKDKLVSVILPGASKVVGIYNFYDCTSLESVTFPEGLKQINKHAFNHCTSLTELTLPASLNLIGVSAFKDCERLKRLMVRAEVPPALQGGAFSGVHKDFTIYVPAKSIEAYRSMSGWKTFAPVIKALEDEE